MHRHSLLITLFALLVSVSAVPAQDKESPFGKKLDDLTAEEILRLVRYSYTVQDQDFDARLRKEFGFIPFKLSLKPNYIRLRFDDPPQAIHLDTSADQLLLREVVAGSNAPVPVARYGEFVRDTDLTYEDLAMRFLYWPKPTIVAQERVKTRPTWKLRLVNPDARGPYRYVDVWVDKASGGMVKMEGYSREEKPRMIKEFEVSHGKKMGDIWIADVIRVRSFEDGKKQGTTYLEILNLDE